MDEKLIYILKKLYESDFVSGEILAGELFISRMAINKRIKALCDLGYKIESIKKRGYRLVDKDIIRIWQVDEYLSKSRLFEKFIYLPSVDSTNSFIKSDIDTLISGTVVYSERQEKGRGRLERAWVDIEKGIKMSFLLKVDLRYTHHVIPLTLYCGLVINSTLKQMGVDSYIKWPNDIYIGKKKVCGILTELVGEVDGKANIIVGIGLNVNSKDLPDEIEDIATTLYKEKNIIFDRTSLIIDILKRFEEEYHIFLEEGFYPFRDRYKNECINIGKEILVNSDEKMFCVDVGDNGELICKKGSLLVKLQSGEITIRF